MPEKTLIVGLGNPGDKYRDTRHNAGFLLLDRLAARWNCPWAFQRGFLAEVAEVRHADGQSLLAKPQTFMNRSGESVGSLARFFHVQHSRVLVVLDDADLPLGTLRLRPQGSAGGHHGLESVIQHLGGNDFPRLKLGIARPMRREREITGHVLGRFSEDEMAVFQQVLDRAVQQVECWRAEGVSKAMNRYNGSVVTAAE